MSTTSLPFARCRWNVSSSWTKFISLLRVRLFSLTTSHLDRKLQEKSVDETGPQSCDRQRPAERRAVACHADDYAYARARAVRVRLPQRHEHWRRLRLIHPVLPAGRPSDQRRRADSG